MVNSGIQRYNGGCCSSRSSRVKRTLCFVGGLAVATCPSSASSVGHAVRWEDNDGDGRRENTDKFVDGGIDDAVDIAVTKKKNGVNIGSTGGIRGGRSELWSGGGVEADYYDVGGEGTRRVIDLFTDEDGQKHILEIIPIERPNQQSHRSSLSDRVLSSPGEESSSSCKLQETDLFLPMQKIDLPLSSTLWKSIELKLPCFKDLIVVVPPDCREDISAVTPPYAKLYVVPEPLPEKFGYLSQQVIKLHADKFTTGDQVLILEADLIFTGWKDECFFTSEGKIKMRCLHYENDDNVERYWKRGTEHALGESVDDDCVVNTPFLYPREVFSELRAHIRQTHQPKTFGQFMEDYYEGHSTAWIPDYLLFSEFNILNHYMLSHMPDKVQRISTNEPEDFWGGADCSQHIGGLVSRNHQLENPKLTSQYYEIAYEHLKEQREYPEVALDLTKIEGQEEVQDNNDNPGE